MSQHQNEAATRNQVKWRQDSIVTDFLGRDRNANNTRNIVAARTNRNDVVTQLSMSQHNYSSKHTKDCRDIEWIE